MKFLPKICGLKDYYVKSTKEWVSIIPAREPDKLLVSDENNVYSLVDKEDVIHYDEYIKQFIKNK